MKPMLGTSIVFLLAVARAKLTGLDRCMQVNLDRKR